MLFWKVFLYVMTVIDAREHEFPDRIQLLNEMRYKVQLAISNSIGPLAQRVGVFDIEFIQSTDSDPRTIDQSGGHLMRQASESPQGEELTNWIAQIFR